MSDLPARFTFSPDSIFADTPPPVQDQTGKSVPIQNTPVESPAPPSDSVPKKFTFAPDTKLADAPKAAAPEEPSGPTPSMFSWDALPGTSGHAAWDHQRSLALAKELADPNHQALLGTFSPDNHLSHTAFGYAAMNNIPGLSLLKREWMPEQKNVEDAYTNLASNTGQKTAGTATGVLASALATRNLGPLAQIAAGGIGGGLEAAGANDTSRPMKIGDVTIPNEVKNFGIGAGLGAATTAGVGLAGKLPIGSIVAHHLNLNDFKNLGLGAGGFGAALAELAPEALSTLGHSVAAHPVAIPAALATAIALGKIGMAPAAGFLAGQLPDYLSQWGHSWNNPTTTANTK